ncbi:MAG: hypothetical protein KJ044_15950, partial [Planctomycetes bacterium]|nr:hypothetical protein [Planctomycetota bacterium]
MNTLAKLVVVVLSAAILAGCGGGLRVIKPEVDDAAGLRAVTAYHVKPVSYDFEVPKEWDVTTDDWAKKTADWSREYANGIAATRAKPVYTLGPGASVGKGAIIETSVTQMKVGTYAYFVKTPGRIWGKVTITDAESGKVLFRGSFDSTGSTDTGEVMTFGGRVKTAHDPVTWDLR